MALESNAQTINQLVPSNPTDGDPLTQGDNHIRLIKKTLQNTFANINSTITASDEEINKLDGLTVSTNELNQLKGMSQTVKAALEGKQAKNPRLTSLSTIAFEPRTLLLTNSDGTLRTISISTDMEHLLDGNNSKGRPALGLKDGAYRDISTNGDFSVAGDRLVPRSAIKSMVETYVADYFRNNNTAAPDVVMKDHLGANSPRKTVAGLNQDFTPREFTRFVRNEENLGTMVTNTRVKFNADGWIEWRLLSHGEAYSRLWNVTDGRVDAVAMFGHSGGETHNSMGSYVVRKDKVYEIQHYQTDTDGVAPTGNVKDTYTTELKYYKGL